MDNPYASVVVVLFSRSRSRALYTTKSLLLNCYGTDRTNVTDVDNLEETTGSLKDETVRNHERSFVQTAKTCCAPRSLSRGQAIKHT